MKNINHQIVEEFLWKTSIIRQLKSSYGKHQSSDSWRVPMKNINHQIVEEFLWRTSIIRQLKSFCKEHNSSVSWRVPMENNHQTVEEFLWKTSIIRQLKSSYEEHQELAKLSPHDKVYSHHLEQISNLKLYFRILFFALYIEFFLKNMICKKLI